MSDRGAVRPRTANVPPCGRPEVRIWVNFPAPRRVGGGSDASYLKYFLVCNDHLCYTIGGTALPREETFAMVYKAKTAARASAARAKSATTSQHNGKNVPPPPQSSAWGMIGPILAVLAVGMAIWVHHDPPKTAAMPQRDPHLDPSVYDAGGTTAETSIAGEMTKPSTSTARRVADAHTPRLIASSDARWAAGLESPVADGPLPKGLLTLEQGRIEFALPSGVHITLEGHCVFETTSDNSIRLERGTLSADVPDEAVGFFVQTPNARVTAIEDEDATDKPAAPTKPGATSESILSPVELSSL